MDLEQAYYLGELIGVIAIVGSLVFVGLQMRQTNRVNIAGARHSMSEFALKLISLQAEHADRLAHISDAETLSSGDIIFLESVHRMVFQMAENYQLHQKMGLMPEDHWKGFVAYLRDYCAGRGVTEFWEKYSDHYGREFAILIDGLIQKKDGPKARP